MLGYYHVFPPKSMNVSVQPVPGDTQGKKRLVVSKDVKEGETIYTVSIFLPLIRTYRLSRDNVLRRSLSLLPWMQISKAKVLIALIVSGGSKQVQQSHPKTTVSSQFIAPRVVKPSQKPNPITSCLDLNLYYPLSSMQV